MKLVVMLAVLGGFVLPGTASACPLSSLNVSTSGGQAIASATWGPCVSTDFYSEVQIQQKVAGKWRPAAFVSNEEAVDGTVTHSVGVKCKGLKVRAYVDYIDFGNGETTDHFAHSNPVVIC